MYDTISRNFLSCSGLPVDPGRTTPGGNPAVDTSLDAGESEALGVEFGLFSAAVGLGKGG